jgi:nicotinate-nucleotide adenylyltransferase
MEGLIGVMGGTFDPPHYGHLGLAESAQTVLRLAQVLWVVTAQPPHKAGVQHTPVDVRVEMVEAAIDGNRAFAVSRADIDRPPPHYAVDTLRWLASRNPGARFAYLIGSDSLRDLPTWHTPVEFVEACELLGVLRRPGVEIDLAALEAQIPGLRSKVRFIDAPELNISGADIRRRVQRRRPFEHLLPDGVAAIIRREHLYQ